MANKPAAYKQQHLLDAVQKWWSEVSVHKQPVMIYVDMKWMFIDYTESHTFNGVVDGIMSYEDFQRCLYKLGIRRISDEGEDQHYVQLETHRPSDESVMRLRLANE